MLSALTLALQRKRPAPQLFLNNAVRKMVTGRLGKRALPIAFKGINPYLSKLTLKQ